MDKTEFMDKLRRALNGNISPSMVQDNVSYYEDYIDSEIRKGKTEKEVMDMLGDPRLIARTIIDTNTDEESTGNGYGSSQYREYYDENTAFDEDKGYYQTESGSYKENPYRQQSYDRGSYRQDGCGSNDSWCQRSGNSTHHTVRMPAWLVTLLVILVLVSIISIVFSALSFLMPVLLPILVVLFLVKLFRDWLN